MPGVFEDGNDAQGEQSLPRFLSSDRSDAVPVILDWAARADAIARVSATAAIAGTALLGSAFMAPEGGQRQAQAMAMAKVRVMPVRIVLQAANEPPLEQRLTYASRLQDHLSAMKQMPALSSVPQPAETAIEVAPPELPPGAAGGPDPAAMLLVRNLPESVTFNDGVPAGIGVWAIGGQDAKDLVNAIKDGPVSPVIAEVEVITGAGLTIASQSIEIPAANTSALAPVAVQAPDVETVKAQEVTAEAKPAKRKRRVHARPRVPVTVAEEVEEKPKPKVKQRKKRVDDAYSGPKLSSPSVEDTNQKQQAAGKEEEKQGTIGKFFTWLKGGNKPAGKAQEEASPSPIAGETDGSLRGLGMSPVEK